MVFLVTIRRLLALLCCVQVLACLVFTSLGVTALLLGRRSGSAIDRGLAGLVAAGCMLPCRMLLPRLYKAANAPPRDQKRGALRSLLKGGVAKIALDQPPAGNMMPRTLMRGRSLRCNQSHFACVYMCVTFAVRVVTCVSSILTYDRMQVALSGFKMSHPLPGHHRT